MPPSPLTAVRTPLMAELCTVVDLALRGAAAEPCAERARRVAQTLEPFLGRPDLLDPAQLEPDPASYRQHVLHVAEDGMFSVVALVWLPGQSTPIHDHTTWCVVGTHLGAEEEIGYRLVTREDGRTVLEETLTTVNPQGTVTYLVPPGDIHLVRNSTEDTVVSLHVYGTDVGARGSSIRRRYTP
jgi:predicted metal-dependent enzyme (double-stranded beta helix superfamily)